MGVSKVRYQIHKEEDDKDSKDAEYKEDIGIDTNKNKRGRVLTEDEQVLLLQHPIGGCRGCLHGHRKPI